MAPLFGKKKGGEKTIAILDIENGSVASALAFLSPEHSPRLAAEVRIEVPLMKSVAADTLSREIERAVKEALLHISEVAARMRTHDILVSAGEIDRTAVFFSPPWAAMHLSGGTADYDPDMMEMTRSAVESAFGDKRMTLHPYGTAAAHGAVTIFPQQAPTILCIVSGEVSELLVIAGNVLVSRATLPIGLNTLLRTLTTHAGISVSEARSLLHLPAHIDVHIYDEPITSAQSHFAEQFADVAKQLMNAAPIEHVLVLAPEPAQEWFAHTLADQPVAAEIFPEGSTVRAMGVHHVMPYFSAHARKPDLALMLEALFVDAKFSHLA